MPLRVINETSGELHLKQGKTMGTLHTKVQVGEEAITPLVPRESLIEPPWTFGGVLAAFGAE